MATFLPRATSHHYRSSENREVFFFLPLGKSIFAVFCLQNTMTIVLWTRFECIFFFFFFFFSSNTSISRPSWWNCDIACCSKSSGTIFSQNKVVCFLPSYSYHHLICSRQDTGNSRGINSSGKNDSVAMSSKALINVPSIPYQPAYLFFLPPLFSFLLSTCMVM
jgi:hypothetical protein